MRVYLLGTAVAAAWLSVSRLHRLQSCDSLVFSLASLYEWTPFFWEQDRVGMLLPLLVSPVRDPLANLIVLTGLMSFCGLLAPLLFARLVCPHAGAYAAVTAGNALMVALGPVVLQENLYTTCVYPLALCLAVPAVGLLDRPTALRTLTAFGLLLLAHWVYLGAVLYVLPLAAGRWLVQPTRSRSWAAVRVGLALAVSVGLMSIAGGEWRRRHPEILNTPSGDLPLADWPKNWLAFLTTLAAHDGFAVWAGVVASAGVAGAMVPARRVRGEWVAVLPLVFAAGVELLLLGTRAWPAMNAYHPRYLLAAVPAVWAAVLVAGWGPVLRDRRAGWVAFALLAAAIGWQYGPPSLANVRAELAAEAGKDTDDFLLSEAEAIGGEYMATWPAVWHANYARHKLGLPTPVPGVTAKASPWAWRWTTGELRHGFRLAGPFDQQLQTRRWIAHHKLTVVGEPWQVGRLAVFTVRPAE